MEDIKYIRGEKPSTITHRLRKLLRINEECYICKKIYNKQFIEIEHPIPLCIGGEVLEFKPCCNLCHKQKTKKDLLIISFFKKLEILNKEGEFLFSTSLSKKRLKELYIKIYEVINDR